MSCCDKPYLMDERDECGCVVEACFHCNNCIIVRWCDFHNPEGGTSE